MILVASQTAGKTALTIDFVSRNTNLNYVFLSCSFCNLTAIVKKNVAILNKTVSINDKICSVGNPAEEDVKKVLIDLFSPKKESEYQSVHFKKSFKVKFMPVVFKSGDLNVYIENGLVKVINSNNTSIDMPAGELRSWVRGNVDKIIESGVGYLSVQSYINTIAGERIEFISYSNMLKIEPNVESNSLSFDIDDISDINLKSFFVSVPDICFVIDSLDSVLNYKDDAAFGKGGLQLAPISLSVWIRSLLYVHNIIKQIITFNMPQELLPRVLQIAQHFVYILKEFENDSPVLRIFCNNPFARNSFLYKLEKYESVWSVFSSLVLEEYAINDYSSSNFNNLITRFAEGHSFNQIIADSTSSKPDSDALSIKAVEFLSDAAIRNETFKMNLEKSKIQNAMLIQQAEEKRTRDKAASQSEFERKFSQISNELVQSPVVKLNSLELSQNPAATLARFIANLSRASSKDLSKNK